MKIEIDSDLEEIVPGFLKNRETDLQELKSAIDNSDFDILEKIGHKVAGSSGGYGFDELGLMAKSLEKNAIDKNFDECKDLVQKMDEHLAAVEVVYVTMD